MCNCNVKISKIYNTSSQNIIKSYDTIIEYSENGIINKTLDFTQTKCNGCINSILFMTVGTELIYKCKELNCTLNLVFKNKLVCKTRN